MKYLMKPQAEQIATITSSVYPQGSSWVLKEIDLNDGTTKLTRGLSQSNAKKRLKTWRREKIEELLRADGSAKAFAIKSLQKNPSWQGEGVWHWAFNRWYTTKEDAQKALEKKQENAKEDCLFEIHEIMTSDVPGHFLVS